MLSHTHIHQLTYSFSIINHSFHWCFWVKTKKNAFFLYLNICHYSWNNPYCSSIESHELIFLYFEITSCLLLWISTVVMILMFRWRQRFIPNSYQSRLLMFHVTIIWMDTKSRSWNQKKKCNNKNSIIILFQWKL